MSSRIRNHDSVSSSNTYIPAKRVSNITSRTGHDSGTATNWNENAWTPRSIRQATDATLSPPPYSIVAVTQAHNSKSTSAEQSPQAHSHLSCHPSLSSDDHETEAFMDPDVQTYNLLKSELSTCPQENLLYYAIQKTRAYDASVKKVTRLQQHIRNLEKLERRPHERTRRWLFLVICLLTAIMILGWSLAGYWKVERDQATRNLEKFTGLNEEGNGLVAPSAEDGSKTKDAFDTVIVSITPQRTTVLVQPTPLPTSIRGKGGSEGHGQGLPLNCVDQGAGAVTCG